MEQAQIKALAALQPFVYQVTTTKLPSPRFLADIITRATSAPGTYIFTELLQLAQIQALSSDDTPDEYKGYLTLLELFSWGTYSEYLSTPDLPKLSEPQTIKLRQLTLLTLASPFLPQDNSSNNLTYESLLSALSLSTSSELENLITTCIYSSLLTARLSPTSDPPTVHITSVAPLRDLRPQSLPSLLHILSVWSSRCDDVISDLTNQITSIHTTARARNTLSTKRQEVIDNAVMNVLPDSNNNTDNERKTRRGGRTKRELDDEEYDDDDGMDVDEGIGEMGSFQLGPGNPMTGGGPSRGTKRNRGRG